MSDEVGKGIAIGAAAVIALLVGAKVLGLFDVAVSPAVAAPADDTPQPVNYKFVAPDLNPLPFNLLNPNTIRGPGSTTVLRGQPCGCSSQTPAYGSAQELQDSLNATLNTTFSDYVDSIVDSMPDTFKQFLNNSLGYNAALQSSNAFLDFADTDALAIGGNNLGKTRGGMLGYGLKTDVRVASAQFTDFKSDDRVINADDFFNSKGSAS